nr:MAG TPA: hypothetical protein [Microviridae sp.]
MERPNLLTIFRKIVTRNKSAVIRNMYSHFCLPQTRE